MCLVPCFVRLWIVPIDFFFFLPKTSGILHAFPNITKPNYLISSTSCMSTFFASLSTMLSCSSYYNTQLFPSHLLTMDIL